MVQDIDPPIPELPGLAGRNITLARAAAIESPILRSLFDWWHARGGSGQLPLRHDFDITQMPALAPHLFIIQPVPRGFELALAGEEYAAMLQLRKGRRWLRDDLDPVERDFASYLDIVTRARKPFRSIGRLELANRNWIFFEALICPVTDTDPGSCAFIGAAVRQSDSQ